MSRFSIIGKRELLLALALCVGSAMADEVTVRAALQPATDRAPAPAFVLDDGAGKSVALSSYRGRVTLLDFWATDILLALIATSDSRGRLL